MPQIIRGRAETTSRATHWVTHPAGILTSAAALRYMRTMGGAIVSAGRRGCRGYGGHPLRGDVNGPAMSRCVCAARRLRAAGNRCGLISGGGCHIVPVGFVGVCVFPTVNTACVCVRVPLLPAASPPRRSTSANKCFVATCAVQRAALGEARARPGGGVGGGG